MTFRTPRPLRKPLFALLSFTALGTAFTVRYLAAQAAASPAAIEASFGSSVKPFFAQNCIACHNSELGTAGIRVDQLDGKLEDRHLPVWEAIARKLRDGSMPPKGMPQPSAADRQKMVDWITQALETARLRPPVKNGLVRRLTIPQYRNTLRELLQLEDDLTVGLPPDAVSKDGFVNNKDTLQLSPMLTESYFRIAEEALNRAIVDPNQKPHIQNFRMDLGAGVNPAPIAEKLILGAGSALLNNEDVLVTQLTAHKPFPFEPFFMRTKYRFIEGYQGNDTVRGWREYDSIYHAVFADMRGSPGYPKGEAYSTVPQGLLLRPAVPTDETFGLDSTYGPKANFKVSLRELPDDGPFRIVVTAAKYNDGLLLDPGAVPQTSGGSLPVSEPRVEKSITLPKAGIYQVDVYPQESNGPAPDASHLSDLLAGKWSPGDTPEQVVIPRDASMSVGTSDFTVAAWIHTGALQKGAIIASGGEGAQGWYLELPDTRGVIRFDTNGPGGKKNGTLSSAAGAIRPDTWQHVAVVVRRGKAGEKHRNEARIFVNGYVAARGAIGPENLDNSLLDLTLARPAFTAPLKPELDGVRLYRRALGDAEIQALLEPGRQFVQPPAQRAGAAGTPARKPQDTVTLTLGDRQFSSVWQQPCLPRSPSGSRPVADRRPEHRHARSRPHRPHPSRRFH